MLPSPDIRIGGKNFLADCESLLTPSLGKGVIHVMSTNNYEYGLFAVGGSLCKEEA